MIRWATPEEVGRLAKAVKLGIGMSGIGGFLTIPLASRWFPEQVLHPGKPQKKRERVFQGLESWAYIAKLLEAGHPVEVMKLDVPPGALGWVLKVVTPNMKVIYIKLQLCDNGHVIGRSFHYSEKQN